MLKKFRKSKGQSADLPQPLKLSVNNSQQSLEFPPILVESVRYMATRLMYKNTLSSRLALVSAIRQEGVTYASRALASVLANDIDKKVCIVELNWWWPDETFADNTNHIGLADVLEQRIPLDKAVFSTNYQNLFVLPSGRMPIKDRPVWARSQRLEELIGLLNQQYDYLIFDIPAVLATNDSIPLASLANSCGLIINQGVTSIENAQAALDEISHLTLSGVILNKVKVNTPSWILKYIPQDAAPMASAQASA